MQVRSLTLENLLLKRKLYEAERQIVQWKKTRTHAST